MSSIPMTLSRNAYSILRANPDAELKELRAAFRLRVRAVHPDVSESPNAEEELKEVLKAWELLKDSQQRAHLDRTLAELLRAQQRRASTPQSKQRGSRGSRGSGSGSPREVSSQVSVSRSQVSVSRSQVSSMSADGRGRTSTISTCSLSAEQHRQRTQSSQRRLHLGDLYIDEGTKRQFTGTVRGDVVVELGAQVRIFGRVEGDLRVLGGRARVEGWVEGNLVVDSGTAVIVGSVEGTTTNRL